MIDAPPHIGSLALKENLRQARLYERGAWTFFGLSVLSIPLMWGALGSEPTWARYSLVLAPIGLFWAAMSNRRGRRDAETKLLGWQSAFGNAAASLTDADR